MASVTEFLRENASGYTDRKSLFEACVVATNRPRKQVQTAWGEIQKSRNPVSLGGLLPEKPNQPLPQLSQHIGISESELRQKHDTRFMIRQAVKQLEKGIFITDTDFIRQINVRNQTGYRSFLDDAEFTPYKGRAGGIIYWSHPESIANMKNEGILR